MMEMEAETLCGAGYDDKSPERINGRNGYRENGPGRPAQAPSTCGCPSCDRAATARPS
jgi:hypothetical protein